MDNLNTIKGRLKTIMALKNVTETDIANHLDIDSETVKLILDNLSAVNTDVIISIATYLDIEFSWLFYGLPEDMLKLNLHSTREQTINMISDCMRQLEDKVSILNSVLLHL